MRSPKVFLLFFSGACLCGIGFTYFLYQGQTQSYYSSKAKGQRVFMERQGDLIAEKGVLAPVPRASFEKAMQQQRDQIKPFYRINKLTNTLAHNQYKQAVLKKEVALSLKATESLHTYLKDSSDLSTLAEKLSANTLTLLEEKQSYIQDNLEYLEGSQAKLAEELEALQPIFLNA